MSEPAPQPTPAHDDPAPRGRVLVVAIGVGVAVLALFELNRPAPDSVTAHPRGLCLSLSDDDGLSAPDWERYRAACDAALAEAPGDEALRQQRARVAWELGQKGLFDQGKRLLDLGQDEGVELLLRISRDSYYSRPAVLALRDAAPAARQRSAQLCLSQGRGPHPEEAWPACQRFMDLSCLLTGSDAALDQLSARAVFADLNHSRSAAERWSPRFGCQPHLATSGTSERRALAIRQRYRDRALAEVMLQYARDPVAGLSQAQALASSSPDSAPAKQALQLMEAANADLQRATQRRAQGDELGALQAAKVALESDARLMPAGYHSDQALILRTELLAQVKALAPSCADGGRPPRALALCQAARALAPEEDLSGACP